MRNGKLLPADKLFQSFVEYEPVRANGCVWGDTIELHPYLGYSYHHREECQASKRINGFGLLGPNFSLTKNSDFFNILLLGGSVAEIFSHMPNEDKSWLEIILNERFVSPNGKPFKLLNGAKAGAWQPSQAITFILLHDLVDAVISIEGFNENQNYQTQFRLEASTVAWLELKALTERRWFLVSTKLIARKIYRKIMKSPVFSHSYFLFLASDSLVKAAYSPILNVFANDPIPKTPPDWSEKQRNDFYLFQYKKYLRDIDGLAKINGAKPIFFLQPVPALFKNLTDSERTVVGDLRYGVKYQKLVEELMRLRSENISVQNLLAIFENYQTNLYVDQIHYNSSGYRVMAENIADKLAKEWSLKEK